MGVVADEFVIDAFNMGFLRIAHQLQLRKLPLHPAILVSIMVTDEVVATCSSRDFFYRTLIAAVQASVASQCQTARCRFRKLNMLIKCRGYEMSFELDIADIAS